MPEIVLYTTKICPYCIRAKLILKRNNLPYREVDVSNPAERRAIVEQSGWRTVPVIYIGDQRIGGSDELRDLERSGQLMAVVNAAAG